MAKKRPNHFRKIKERPNHGNMIRDMILGGQDGLVNVLALVLGVATAIQDIRIILIAGLAAAFAESISMAAVAYTSTKAAKEFYKSELKREEMEVKEVPEMERKEIRDIYYKKGFRGNFLNAIVNKITSNRKVWIETMMLEELHLTPEQYANPAKSATIVGFSAVIGSLIPLIPFFSFPLIPISSAVIYAIVLSSIILFISGAVKAKITVGNWVKSGTELAVIGIAAAVVGYLIGSALGVVYV